MIVPGPCRDCGAALASDQRYCISCGARVGAPLAMPYAEPALAAAPAQAEAGTFWDRLPFGVQTATAAAALALGFGIVAGTAISPNLGGPLAGPAVVVQQPPAAPAPEPAPVSSGGGRSIPEAAPAATSPPATVASAPVDSGGSGGGGGGGGKTKEPKEKPTFLSGTVIHKNPIAGSYSLAASGAVSAIHARTQPAVGAVVRAPVRLLANRTFAEDGKRQLKGQAGAAGFTGVVTHAQDSSDPAVPDAYMLSLRGWSIAIHMPPDATPAQEQHPPALGAFATVAVELRAPAATPTPFPPDPAPPALSCAPPPQPAFPSPPVVLEKELHQTSLQVDPPNPGPVSVQVETVVQGTCPGTGEALFSSDDIREAGADVRVSAGPGIDVAQLVPGSPIIANVSVAGGALTQITGVQSDAGIAGADGSAGSQGDLRAAAAPASAEAPAP